MSILSQPTAAAAGTPTKRLKLLVSRILTPPNLVRVYPDKTLHETSSIQSRDNESKDEVITPKKSGNDGHEESKRGERGDQMQEESLSESVDSPVGRRKGKRGIGRVGAVGIRSSPRSNVKRGKQGETHTREEKVKEKGDMEREDDGKSVIVADNNEEERENKMTKHPRQPKARKVIKYIDDDDDDGSLVKETGSSKKEAGNNKEQTILTATVTSSLSCVSPSKKASPLKPHTPEREGCLVKQPGLTFDKELSVSPVKNSRQQQEGGRMNDRLTNKATSPVSKPVSSPVKPVSSLTKSVSTPRNLSSTKPVTPVSANRSSIPTSTTPSLTTPKVTRGNSYRNYMNRGGPKAPGSKVVPEGEENCLEGLTFVITGVLESLERDQAADIIKR